MKRFAILILLAFIAGGTISLAHATPVTDCTKWKEMRTDALVVSAVNNMQIVAQDLWYALYADSATGFTCSRFFIKSNNLTIWQNWQGDGGKSFAYLLMPDNTPYVFPDARVRWRVDLINLSTGAGKLELGVFLGNEIKQTRQLDIPITNKPSR